MALLRKSAAFLFLAGLCTASVAHDVKAQSFSYCLQGGSSSRTQLQGARVSDIYISGSEGRILEICVEIPGARLGVSEDGSLSLLERDADVEVSYSSSGLVREIDDIDIDYFSSGDRTARVQSIEGLDFAYFSSGSQAGKLRAIESLKIEYFSSGSQAGMLRKIDSVTFEYGSGGIIEADDSLRGIDLVIR